ncbi:serine/threonine-protein kinase [Luteitalea sp. TBR-22]|uniref:serine/threonine-protein kinase n=1 Tax=Luteitalea sp. TBR-22 TaxID=2802971 RepID=UPI001EF4AF3C|nr:serine/threonine-protein kinase [Luteitalea sp. TBR-22]
MTSTAPHGSSLTPTLTTSLPPALMAQAARRLRVMALLYAGVFFVAGILPVLLLPEERTIFFSHPTRWLPSALSIGTALVVAFVAGRPALTPEAVVRLGLLFQVVGTLGIAWSEYLQPADGTTAMSPMKGLSWAAVWMLSFTITVPSPPRQAFTAAMSSAVMVPLVAALATRWGYLPSVSGPEFFLHVVLPYLVVVAIAGVGARLVYSLGVDLKRAQDLGSYQLEERLGFGGMGEVWRARHRLLARPAAVKLIRPEVFEAAGIARQSELRLRFEREAQTTALLQSPHTIHLFDYGVTEEGAFYYVMELLDGFDLRTLVDRFGPLPVERAVHLLVQACHSLAEAHAVGLVHRDITPANIFVCRYGRDVDFVKVLDFGLVKPHETSVRDESIARRDRVGGTPAFMSPEQALADRPIDARSDLYALGCVGYWLVTGAVVFPRNTPMAMAVAHTQAVPEPPSARTELPIPPEFDALILECLAKAPEDRPPSAEDLAQRLQRLTGLPPWERAQARAWWNLHKPIDPARKRLAADTTAVRTVRPRR